MRGTKKFFEVIALSGFHFGIDFIKYAPFRFMAPGTSFSASVVTVDAISKGIMQIITVSVLQLVRWQDDCDTIYHFFVFEIAGLCCATYLYILCGRSDAHEPS